MIEKRISLGQLMKMLTTSKQPPPDVPDEDERPVSKGFFTRIKESLYETKEQIVNGRLHEAVDQLWSLIDLVEEAESGRCKD